MLLMRGRFFFDFIEECFQATLTDLILRQFRGREAGPGEAPEIYEILAGLETVPSLGNVRFFVAASASANAFAVGSLRAGWTMGITRGVFDLLNPREFAALLEALALRAGGGFFGRQIAASIFLQVAERLGSVFFSFWSFSSGGRLSSSTWKKLRGDAGRKGKGFFLINSGISGRRPFRCIHSEPERTRDLEALLSAYKKMAVRLCDKPLKGFPSWLAPFWLLDTEPGPFLWRRLAALEVQTRNKTQS